MEVFERDGYFVVRHGSEVCEVCPCCRQRMTLDAANRLMVWMEGGGDRLEIARRLTELGRVVIEKRARKSWQGL